MGSWDKQKIVASIVQQLTQELADIVKSAAAAYSGAKHEDAVAKSKYDTHGLELSYLAGAQFERANILQAQIGLYQNLKLKHFTSNDPIDVSAVVELKNREGSVVFFLGISGVSAKLQVDGVTIQLISVESPLGEELIGLSAGDDLEVSMGIKRQSYQIVAVH